MTFDHDWVDKTRAATILKIKKTQLRNDTALLRELSTEGFDYIPYSDKGYGRKSMQVLIEFRELVRSRGRTRAILEINQHMEDYFERERQGSR